MSPPSPQSLCLPCTPAASSPESTVERVAAVDEAHVQTVRVLEEACLDGQHWEQVTVPTHNAE